MENGTNFETKQLVHREDAWKFFKNEDTFRRLFRLYQWAETFDGGSGTGYSVLFFFASKFEKDTFVVTEHGVYFINNEYSNAITNYKKRYYDFESKIGKGDLLWRGEVNPGVSVKWKNREVVLPLPKLVAVKWLILFDFDLFFWQKVNKVVATYTANNAQAKQRYSETYKAKKNRCKCQCENKTKKRKAPAQVRDGKQDHKRQHQATQTVCSTGIDKVGNVCVKGDGPQTEKHMPVVQIAQGPLIGNLLKIG